MAGTGLTFRWGETVDDYVSRIESIWVPGMHAAIQVAVDVAAVKADVAKLAAAPVASVDAAQLGAALAANDAFVSAVAEAIATRIGKAPRHFEATD